MLTNNNFGDSENFCLRALFYHCPQLIQKIFDDHKMGIGIFTLQGFDRRNKESKWVAKIFYNGNHNVCFQVLSRVFDLCFFKIRVRSHKNEVSTIQSSAISFSATSLLSISRTLFCAFILIWMRIGWHSINSKLS